MTTLTRNSEPFIYHNPYENSFQTDFQNSIVPLKDPVSDMSIERDNAVANDPALQNFTATGRPIPHPKDSRQGRAWQAYASADSLGQGPANFGPVRFTDDSVISIAVMPPEGVEAKTVDDDSDEDDGPIKAEPKKKFGFFRRKSSAYAKKKDKPFVMKQVTRADYLKYYAKDDDGNYTGTMDPAPDCILNNEKDRFKVRKAFASREAKTTGFMNSMVMIDPPRKQNAMYDDPEFAKYYSDLVAQGPMNYHKQNAAAGSSRAASAGFAGPGAQFAMGGVGGF